MMNTEKSQKEAFRIVELALSVDMDIEILSYTTTNTGSGKVYLNESMTPTEVYWIVFEALKVRGINPYSSFIGEIKDLLFFHEGSF